MSRPWSIALLTATLLTSSAFAAEKADECGGRTAAPPPEIAAWGAPSPTALTMARAPVSVPALVPGVAVELVLGGEAGMRFASAPGKPGNASSFAGLVALDVTKAGVWRVALGKAAWVDVVRDGVSVASTGHGHGPACTGIRKIVDFPLEPGRYVIQLSAAPADRITALVLPPP